MDEHRQERKVVAVLFCELVGSPSEADAQLQRALAFWPSLGATVRPGR